MMRLVLPTALALLLCGCERGGGGGEDKPSQERSNGEKGAAATGTIKLTGEAQRIGGIRVAQVSPRKLPQTLQAAGQIVLNEERTAHIGSYVAARVLTVFAAPGDSVKRGAVLARMHSHEVHETLAAYRTAKEEVVRQRNALDFGGKTRDRMHRLYDLKSASLQEVERSESDYRGLQANFVNSETALHREVAHLSDILHVSEKEIDRVDESMEEVPVVAPISGIVTARTVTAGTVVEPGQEVFTVADTGSVWMLAAVNEPDIGKIRMGQRANVKTQAFADQMFPATITRINSELDSKTRTLPVRLLVPNPGGRLRSGMYAVAEINEGISRNALFIPEEALQDVNGGTVAFVKEDGDRFEMRPVQVARRMDGEAEITSGVKAGETVIVKGSFIAKSEVLKSQIGE